MAYGLKYTSYIADKANTRITINIYQDGWSGLSYQIGTLQNLSLDIQGSQGEIYAPIIKTSVSLSLVDAFDKGSAQADGTTCVTDGKKWGRWEEFYTNDVTKYKVELKNGSSVIWTGFITPDSWGEDMQYRGSITIVARDMLGYLDELEFDLSGTTTVRNLISTAQTKSKGAMPFTFYNAECLYNKNNSQSILDHIFGCDTFEEKSWYQALEQTLESLGLILRYNGQNGFFITSLRYLTQHTLGTRTPAFIDRSGHRTLDPAAKQITETLDVDFISYIPPEPQSSEIAETAASPKYQSYYKYESGSVVVQGTYEVNRAVSTLASGWTGSVFGVPPAMWPYYADTKRVNMYFLATMDPDTDPCPGYWNTLVDDTIKGSLNFRWELQASILGYNSVTGYCIPLDDYAAEIEWVKTRFYCVVDGTTYWYNDDGQWTSTYTDNHCIHKIAPGSDFFLNNNNGARVYVQAGHIYLPTNNICQAFYVPLNVALSVPERIAAPDEQKTTTVYNTSNHKEITRKPAIGSLTASIAAVVSQNLLSYNGMVAANLWNWSNETDGYPLSVMIQAQLLVLYASQNGNSIFTGTAAIVAGSAGEKYAQMPLPGYKYTYYSRNCILQSGTFDFSQNLLQSANFRECLEWSDIWSAFSPTYTKTEGYGKGSTSKTSTGGGTSGGGGGGTGLTSVGLTVPAGFETENSPLTANGNIVLKYASGYSLPETSKQTAWDTVVTWITTNGANILSHLSNTGIHVTTTLKQQWSTAYTWVSNNGTNVLNHIANNVKHITSAERTAWDGKYEKPSAGIPATDMAATVQAALDKAHEHGNKDVLDGITSSFVADWNNAVSAKHTHDNKAVLDTVTASVVSNSHTHSNKLVLDGISANDVTGWNDAADKKHTHDNKTVLDSVTAAVVNSSHTHDNLSELEEIETGDVAKWNDAADDAHTHGNKSVLDGITASFIADWNGAAEAKHTHANKTVLDEVTAAVVNNSHTHGNKALLDDITTNNINAWNDAADKKHAHDNKAILDTVTAAVVSNSHTHSNQSELDEIETGDVDKWDGAASKAHEHGNKTVLDGITASNVADWNNAVSDKHTHSNKALLDTYAQTEVNLADAVGKKHEHSNKSTLDGITAAKITAWDGAVEDEHTHDNLSDLDGITAAKIAAWDGAVSDKHTHSNKDVLDGVTSSLIADWNGAADAKHTHSNKALLDTYTQTEVNLADAVGKKHEHSNKSVLDDITTAKVSDWDDAVTDKHTHSNLSDLEDITSAQIDSWDGAVEAQHTHSNKDVLDGITASNVADWTDAATKKHTHTNLALLETYAQTEENLADAVTKKHSHSNKSELDKIESGDVDNWNDTVEALGGHSVGVNVPSNAKFTDTVYDDTALDQRVTDVEDDLDDKVDKVSGKGLSTNDFTTAYKTQLDGLTNVVKHDGTANAVQNIVVCSPYPATLDSNTLYILI